MSCAPWSDAVIVAAELKTESQEQGELIQPLQQIRQLLSQVPDQGAGILLASSRVAHGAVSHPGTMWQGGWCLWDRAGDLHPSLSLQLSVELGMGSGPQGDTSTTDTLTFCWREAEGETENTNNEELVGDEEMWVNPASYHSSTKGHGYPSAAIWRLLCRGIPLFFSR